MKAAPAPPIHGVLAHLQAAGAPITSGVVWSNGGQSLYFNDPDGNVAELATPGLWPNY